MTDDNEDDAGWVTNKEKLLCLMVQDDSVAEQLSRNAGPAFWRAFIVENRESLRVYAKFRFNYQGENNRHWFRIDPKEQDEHTAERLRVSLEKTQSLAMAMYGVDPLGRVLCFYPPDDGGNPNATVIWLEMHDLIERKELN